MCFIFLFFYFFCFVLFSQGRLATPLVFTLRRKLSEPEEGGGDWDLREVLRLTGKCVTKKG